MDTFASHLEEGVDTLGTRIRRARLQRLWTLEHLAECLGVSKVTIWNWERDRTRPRLQRLEELSAVLDMPVDVLVNGSDAEPLAISELVSECQVKIAAMVGVQPEHIEIKIRFGGGDD